VKAAAHRTGVDQHPGAADAIAEASVDAGEHQRGARTPLPPSRRAHRQRLREARSRDLAHERLAERELPDGKIRRRAHDVAVLHQLVVAPALCLLDPALDDVEVAEEHVDGRALDGQPGAAVNDRAPLAQ
jgi:hypothetical protein